MSLSQVKEIIGTSISGMTLKKIVFSRPISKNSGAQRADARPVMLKSGLNLQIGRYMSDGKALFVNVDMQKAADEIASLLLGEFKQLNIITSAGECQAACKDGEVKIVYNRIKEGDAPAEQVAVLSHNSKKQYILPDEPLPFFVKLGITDANGRVYDKRRAKYRQINRFLEYLRDVVDKLGVSDEICVYDLCCGKGYLTFAAYYYLEKIRGLKTVMVGADLKDDVIKKCAKIAEDCGFDGLEFVCGDIADIRPDRKVDLVIALHACDIATDIAISHAVKWNARAILSAPCCQHELPAQMEGRASDSDSLMKQNLLRYRFAQMLTDAIRCSVLEICGYGVQAVEFIDPDETDKNLMIRAVKRGRPPKNSQLAAMKQALRDELARHNVSPSIVVMLQDKLK